MMGKVKLLVYVALCLLVFGGGIWLGYKIRKPVVIEKEPERVVVTEWREKKVIVPADTMDIMRILLEKGIVRRYNDTMAVLRDYITERVYDTIVVFKDGGSLGLTANIQYNRVESLAYSYKPSTQVRANTLRPYVTAGYLGGLYMGGGVQIKDRWQVGFVTDGIHIGGNVSYLFGK